MIQQLLAALWRPLAWLLGALWLRRDARKDARQETALAAAEAAARANAEAAANLERIVNVPVLDADRARERMRARDPGTR